MDNFYQLNTWQGLFSLVVLLIILYWVIKGISLLLEELGKRTLAKRNTIDVIKKILIVFKPVATLLIVLDFIAINYITHSILLVVIGVFGYKHIKNYLNGIVLKLNPLVVKGALIEYQGNTGEIKQLLPFGLIINTEKGERFVNYSTIEENGFAVNSNEHSASRQTLFVETEIHKEKILDLLFDNPILDLSEPPTLKSTDNERVLKLQYTLETGATTEDLVAFFEAKKINSNLTITKTA